MSDVLILDSGKDRSGRITVEAFFDRFTKNELRDLELAKLDVPTDSQANRRDQANLRAWDIKIRFSSSIKLSSNKISNFLDDLVAANVITAARKIEIQTTPISPDELA